MPDLFNQIERTTDTGEVRNLASAAIAELVRHFVAEEQYLYPAMREHLDDGDSLVDHEIEEDDALARLQQTCPREQLVELGRQVEQAKKIAPTRPRPMAPDKPPMNKILAPGAGLVDRVRDALAGRPE